MTRSIRGQTVSRLGWCVEDVRDISFVIRERHDDGYVYLMNCETGEAELFTS